MMEATLITIGITGKDDLVTIDAISKRINTFLLWSAARVNRKSKAVRSQHKVTQSPN